VSDEVQVYDIGDAPMVECVFWSNQTELTAWAKSGDLTIPVRDPTGYLAGTLIVLDPDQEEEEFLEVASVSGATLTLAAAIRFSHAARVLDGRITEPVVGKLASPAAATLTVRKGDGTYLAAVSHPTTDLEVSIGRFARQLDPLDVPGDWWHRWEGTATIRAAAERRFVVRRSQF
jgi:hypothetical protein